VCTHVEENAGLWGYGKLNNEISVDICSIQIRIIEGQGLDTWPLWSSSAAIIQYFYHLELVLPEVRSMIYETIQLDSWMIQQYTSSPDGFWSRQGTCISCHGCNSQYSSQPRGQEFNPEVRSSTQRSGVQPRGQEFKSPQLQNVTSRMLLVRLYVILYLLLVVRAANEGRTDHQV